MPRCAAQFMAHLIPIHLISSPLLTSNLLMSQHIASPRINLILSHLLHHITSYHIISYHSAASPLLSPHLLSYPVLFSPHTPPLPLLPSTLPSSLTCWSPSVWISRAGARASGGRILRVEGTAFTVKDTGDRGCQCQCQWTISVNYWECIVQMIAMMQSVHTQPTSSEIIPAAARW